MIAMVQMAGLVAVLLSCGFWLASAGVRFRPLSLFTLRGPDSIQASLERQSLLNAFAAAFASAGAGAQAFALYLQSAQ